MLSMTGYGTAQVHGSFGSLTVRVRTLNGKSLRVTWRIDDLLRPFLVEAESLLRTQIERGSVEVDAEVELPSSQVWEVDEEMLSHYAEIASRYGSVDGARLLALPGVVRQRSLNSDLLRRPFLRALRAAFTEVRRRRREEGKALKKALTDLLRRVETIRGKVEREYERSVSMVAERLAARIRQAMEHLGVCADDAGLLREAAIIAERTDVREELDRLAAHTTEFRRMMRMRGPVGLRLDFLAQEMHREAATLAAKCAEVGLAPDIVELRALVAAIRQQVQNIE